MWASLIPLAASAISAISNKNSSDRSAAQVGNLQYQPIDIAALQSQARANAEANAKGSIALEREINPGVADARQASSALVASDLKNPGALPLDTANQVTRSAMTSADRAGLYGGAGPITAAQLGLTSLQLHNDRLNRALQLAQGTALPQAGLDPGAVANLAVGQNNAQNQFNLAKTGALNSANQSTANANSAIIGSLGAIGSEIFKK